jgi:hypothetical protein
LKAYCYDNITLAGYEQKAMDQGKRQTSWFLANERSFDLTNFSIFCVYVTLHCVALSLFYFRGEFSMNEERMDGEGVITVVLDGLGRHLFLSLSPFSILSLGA